MINQEETINIPTASETKTATFPQASRIWESSSTQLGVTWDGLGVNFSLFSANATKVELCLFDPPGSGARRLQRFPDALERHRPRHSHPEGSQSRVREASMTVRTWASSGTEPDRCREIRFALAISH